MRSLVDLFCLLISQNRASDASSATFCSCRKDKTERLQAYAKTKELEKSSLEKQINDNKMAQIFVKVAQMSLSSYIRVWSNLAVKNRGRQLQIIHTVAVLWRRKTRTRESAAFRGWYAQMLQARKVDKVRSVIRKHTYDQFFGTWCYTLKMRKVASMLYKAGQMEEGKKKDLLKASLRDFKSYVRYQSRLRKAMNILRGGYEGRTILEFLLNWRSISAANLLKKAGFGSKAMDKTRPGSIRRTGSTDSSHGAIRRTGSSDSSRPSIQRTGSNRSAKSESKGQSRVGRTGSPGPGISRVGSFASIVESDDDEGDPLPHCASPGGEPAFSRLGSAASHASAASAKSVASSSGRTPSSGNLRRGLTAISKESSSESRSSAASLSPLVRNRSMRAGRLDPVHQLSGEGSAVAQQAVVQEAFLSTLLRGGGVFEI